MKINNLKSLIKNLNFKFDIKNKLKLKSLRLLKFITNLIGS